MKITIILKLSILFLLACLASCDEGVIHLGHRYEYIVYETGHYKQFTCGCPSPDILEEHRDYDKNDICDVCGSILPTVLEEHYDNDGDLHCDACGFLISIASNDIEWQYTDKHHWFIPQQGNGPQMGIIGGYGEHENMDADLFCDVCGYFMGTSDPYQKLLLSNQLGAEWLSEITSDNIAEIKMIYDYEGIGPGTTRYVASSTFEAPIRRIFNELLNMEVTPVSRDEAIVPGGSNLTVEFLLKDGTKREFIFYDGCYHDVGNDRYYRLAYRPTFNDAPEYTSYYQYLTIGEWDKCEVWCDDPTEPYFVCDIPLEELKFNIFNEAMGGGVSEYPYFIETDFGRLGFLRNDVFFVVGGGTYYQLVDKSLDEIIAYATEPNYSILIDAYWEKIPQAESVSVVHYYGEFSSGAIVAMMTCSEEDYDEALWEEVIADVTIYYNNGNRIIVLYDGEFYSLTVAYNNGYITGDDLVDISEKQKEYFPYLYE